MKKMNKENQPKKKKKYSVQERADSIRKEIKDVLVLSKPYSVFTALGLARKTHHNYTTIYNALQYLLIFGLKEYINISHNPTNGKITYYVKNEKVYNILIKKNK
jgi:hypothetical protein